MNYGFRKSANVGGQSQSCPIKKRRSYSEIREAYEGYVSDAKLKFKELTPFEQKKVRDKIIAKAKEDRIQEVKHYIYALLVFCFFALIIYSVFL